MEVPLGTKISNKRSPKSSTFLKQCTIGKEKGKGEKENGLVQEAEMFSNTKKEVLIENQETAKILKKMESEVPLLNSAAEGNVGKMRTRNEREENGEHDRREDREHAANDLNTMPQSTKHCRERKEKKMDEKKHHDENASSGEDDVSKELEPNFSTWSLGSSNGLPSEHSVSEPDRVIIQRNIPETLPEEINNSDICKEKSNTEIQKDEKKSSKEMNNSDIFEGKGNSEIEKDEKELSDSDTCDEGSVDDATNDVDDNAGCQLDDEGGADDATNDVDDNDRCKLDDEGGADDATNDVDDNDRCKLDDEGGAVDATNDVDDNDGCKLDDEDNADDATKDVDNNDGSKLDDEGGADDATNDVDDNDGCKLDDDGGADDATYDVDDNDGCKLDDEGGADDATNDVDDNGGCQLDDEGGADDATYDVDDNDGCKLDDEGGADDATNDVDDNGGCQLDDEGGADDATNDVDDNGGCQLDDADDATNDVDDNDECQLHDVGDADNATNDVNDDGCQLDDEGDADDATNDVDDNDECQLDDEGDADDATNDVVDDDDGGCQVDDKDGADDATNVVDDADDATNDVVDDDGGDDDDDDGCQVNDKDGADDADDATNDVDSLGLAPLMDIRVTNKKEEKHSIASMVTGDKKDQLETRGHEGAVIKTDTKPKRLGGIHCPLCINKPQLEAAQETATRNEKWNSKNNNFESDIEEFIPQYCSTPLSKEIATSQAVAGHTLGNETIKSTTQTVLNDCEVCSDHTNTDDDADAKVQGRENTAERSAEKRTSNETPNVDDDGNHCRPKLEVFVENTKYDACRNHNVDDSESIYATSEIENMRGNSTRNQRDADILSSEFEELDIKTQNVPRHYLMESHMGSRIKTVERSLGAVDRITMTLQGNDNHQSKAAEHLYLESYEQTMNENHKLDSDEHLTTNQSKYGLTSMRSKVHMPIGGYRQRHHLATNVNKSPGRCKSFLNSDTPTKSGTVFKPNARERDRCGTYIDTGNPKRKSYLEESKTRESCNGKSSSRNDSNTRYLDRKRAIEHLDYNGFRDVSHGQYLSAKTTNAMAFSEHRNYTIGHNRTSMRPCSSRAIHERSPYSKSMNESITTSDIGTVQEIRFPLSRGPGIAVERRPRGIYVREIIEGRDAFRDGRLAPGDRLLTMNGYNISIASFGQARAVLRKLKQDSTENFAIIQFLRESGSAESAGKNHTRDISLYEADSSLDQSMTLPFHLNETSCSDENQTNTNTKSIQQGILKDDFHPSPLMTSTPVRTNIVPKDKMSSGVSHGYQGIGQVSHQSQVCCGQEQLYGGLLMIHPHTKVHISKLESSLSYLGLDFSEYQKYLLRSELHVDPEGYVIYEEFARSARDIYASELSRDDRHLLTPQESHLIENPSRSHTSPQGFHSMESLSRTYTSPLPDLIPQVSIDYTTSRKLDDLLTEKDRIKDEIMTIKSRINSRTKILQNVEVELAEVKNDLKRARQQKVVLMRKDEQIENARTRAKSKTREYESAISSLEQEISSLKASQIPMTSQAMSKCAAVQTQIRNLVERLRSAEKSNRNYYTVTQRLMAFTGKVQRVLNADDSVKSLYNSSSDHTYQVVSPAIPSPKYARGIRKAIKKADIQSQFLSMEARKVMRTVRGLLAAEMLPYGWEEASTEKGIRFYIDHVTGATTWQKPTLTRKK